MSPPAKPLEDRFWPKVEEVENGCWVWKGMTVKNGRPVTYGLFSVREGPGRWRNVVAHRVAYELVVGLLPGRAAARPRVPEHALCEPGASSALHERGERSESRYQAVTRTAWGGVRPLNGEVARSSNAARQRSIPRVLRYRGGGCCCSCQVPRRAHAFLGGGAFVIPERVTVYVCPECGRARLDSFPDCGDVFAATSKPCCAFPLTAGSHSAEMEGVDYVPASRLEQVEKERDALRERLFGGTGGGLAPPWNDGQETVGGASE